MTELLARHTTFRIGGPARTFIVAETQDDLIAAVRAADDAGEPLLILSGGSNLLVSDDGFPGTVVKVATTGIVKRDIPVCGGVTVDVAAGESWDGFVAHCVDNGWIGVEALSGIPGLVGSTPIQNVGAYGQEVGQTIASVRTYDRKTRSFATFAASECRFGYRSSRFKNEPGRYVILEVTFQFRLGELSAPVRFGQLATALGVDEGGRVPMREVRRTVLELRRRKGMVVDNDDPDSWSAGSFFTNPIVAADVAATLPADAPRYPQPDGRIKTSAAWLIEHAGFGKGYGTPPATLSTKHTLALTNRGGATASDVLALAREIRQGVQDRFQVTLEPEPVLVGCSL